MGKQRIQQRSNLRVERGVKLEDVDTEQRKGLTRVTFSDAAILPLFCPTGQRFRKISKMRSGLSENFELDQRAKAEWL